MEVQLEGNSPSIHGIIHSKPLFSLKVRSNVPGGIIIQL